ncbi:type I pullulanase [Salipaludibacillus daqingensis]|uniref:type I pullulanase n=1 Tax=Salipaludibacillus daqingensis TaxID=3041001 RepID=UPI002473711B|nr:type I pullulanase [Salipaludibacillus daqingensis]
MKKCRAWINDCHLVELEGEFSFEEINDHEEAMIVESEITNIIWKLSVKEVINDRKVIFHSAEPLPLGKELMFKYNGINIPVYAGAVVRTAWFDMEYDASHLEYGALYEKEATTFRVWSPIATSMHLLLDGKAYVMKRKEKGVWEYEINQNCHGLPYLYRINVNGEVLDVIDPYAKALTANSQAAVVTDLSKTDPDNFRITERVKMDRLQDSSIYELHVRDATVHPESGVTHKGKYLGLTEPNTKTSRGFSTGLDYITELGVTHVQLLPVNDFARVDDLQPDNKYNWGYDPLFYQTPEGSYSSNPTDPFSRVTELKKLVQAFHERNVSIILDVVYNHVFIMEESSFEKLVPGYYFRYHAHGEISNGTGVGNDFASERAMGRKFILDSIDYWLTEYLVDGFRFDLMGAIDIETMKKIKERCDQEDGLIMLLGEGWELPTAIDSMDKATSHQSHQLPGVRFFNDFFRDSVKGNNFDLFDYGYVNGKGKYIERLPQLVKGSSSENEWVPPFVSDVNQTVNYVECHDNHTLWDRLLTSNEEEEDDDRKQMAKLAIGLTIVSQGIPFIHAGQEWFRSKDGDGNSYISGDIVNQLNWIEREKNEDHIDFVRRLLKIRNEHPVFRLISKNEIDRRVHVLPTPAPTFGFTLLGDGKDLCIYVNPTKKRFQMKLPSFGNWDALLSNVGQKPISSSKIVGEYTELEPYEFLVIKKIRV